MKVAVVTGAGSGIGRAASMALAQDGWRVVLAGRREDTLAGTAGLIAGETLAVPTDVTSEVEVDALFARAVAEWGQVDLLFNNAGMSLPAARVDAIELHEWNELMTVNLTGAFLCLRAAFRTMAGQEPQGGRIINNGSLSAHVPRLYSAAYTASKHAITGLTRATSLDGRAVGIACGQIDIGNAATDIGAGTARGALQADGSTMPEPMIDVAEAGRAVAHMASLPPAANVQFMTIMASAMPFIGRG